MIGYLILIVVSWFYVAMLAYALVRYTKCRMRLGWSVGDRRICLVTSLLFGPCGFFAALVMLVIAMFVMRDGPPARW